MICIQPDFSHASNLKLFIAENSANIDLQSHSHHQAVDYKVADVRIVSNPRGYPTREISDGFREDKLLYL